MEIKVINLNVWLGGKLMPNILNFLSKENADILSLQEVRKSKDLNYQYQTEKIIKDKLNYKYSSFAPAFFDTTENSESGNLILSKYPIIQSDFVFLFGNYSDYIHGQNPKYFPIVPRNIQHAQIQIGNTIVNNYNLQGIWAHRDGSDSPNRLIMSDIIINQIKNKEKVILTGDFNAQEGAKTINNIEKYLTNIFKGERKTSFNMKQKTDPGYASAVVDFIFVSSDIKVVSKSMPDVDISDHLPLVANLAL